MPFFLNSNINISGIRPPYFILKISGRSNLTEKKGAIFSENGIKMGEFMVLKVSSDEILCQCIRRDGDLNQNCYVILNRAEDETVKRGENLKGPAEREGLSSEGGVIKIRGIRFDQHEKNIYITESPVPVSIIPDVTFQGINNFLKKIENEYEKQCRISCLTSGEMIKYMSPGDEMILLGVRNGSPVMVFFSVSGPRENPVSGKIMEKLKYKLHMPLKLERL